MLLTCTWLQTLGFGLDLALLVALEFPELFETLPDEVVDLTDGFCVFCICAVTVVDELFRCCCGCCADVCCCCCCCCCCVCCMICWMSSNCCFVRPSLLAPGDVALCKTEKRNKNINNNSQRQNSSNSNLQINTDSNSQKERFRWREIRHVLIAQRRGNAKNLNK